MFEHVFTIIGMNKLARLRVRDLEDEAGFYFTDGTENYARKRLASERSKSFVLRHPVITGGIPATLKKGKVKRKIVREILSKDKKAYKAHKDYINTRREYRQALIKRQTNELKGELKRRFGSQLLKVQSNQ